MVLKYYLVLLRKREKKTNKLPHKLLLKFIERSTKGEKAKRKNSRSKEISAVLVPFFQRNPRNIRTFLKKGTNYQTSYLYDPSKTRQREKNSKSTLRKRWNNHNTRVVFSKEPRLPSKRTYSPESGKKKETNKLPNKQPSAPLNAESERGKEGKSASSPPSKFRSLFGIEAIYEC